jgi:hypothetical protein
VKAANQALTISNPGGVGWGDGGWVSAAAPSSYSLNVVNSGSYGIALRAEAQNPTAAAGLFSGNVNVYGSLSKSGGSFKIDHPLDPASKYLYHSFVESPDMMNIYNGNATLDERGEARVTMPDWFESLNRDFRYQLTCIGGFAPVFVASEISGNSFRIGGGFAGLKVSWQVTGVRRDAWAEANRIPVEQDKAVHEKGLYLHPELYGRSAADAIGLIEREARRAPEPETGHSGPPAPAWTRPARRD